MENNYLYSIPVELQIIICEYISDEKDLYNLPNMMRSQIEYQIYQRNEWLYRYISQQMDLYKIQYRNMILKDLKYFIYCHNINEFLNQIKCCAKILHKSTKLLFSCILLPEQIELIKFLNDKNIILLDLYNKYDHIKILDIMFSYLDRNEIETIYIKLNPDIIITFDQFNNTRDHSNSLVVMNFLLDNQIITNDLKEKLEYFKQNNLLTKIILSYTKYKVEFGKIKSDDILILDFIKSTFTKGNKINKDYTILFSVNIDNFIFNNYKLLIECEYVSTLIKTIANVSNMYKLIYNIL